MTERERPFEMETKPGPEVYLWSTQCLFNVTRDGFLFIVRWGFVSFLANTGFDKVNNRVIIVHYV